MHILDGLLFFKLPLISVIMFLLLVGTTTLNGVYMFPNGNKYVKFSGLSYG